MNGLPKAPSRTLIPAFSQREKKQNPQPFALAGFLNSAHDL